MATVLNRTTKQYLESVNTPDYPAAQWIHNPNLSAVQGWPSKYWTISGDNVLLMSEGERNNIDAIELSNSRDRTSNRMDDIEDIVRALGLSVIDLTNIHATSITDILNAVDNATNFTDLKTRIAAINDVAQRTGQQLKTQIRSKLGL